MYIVVETSPKIPHQIGVVQVYGPTLRHLGASMIFEVSQIGRRQICMDRLIYKNIANLSSLKILALVLLSHVFRGRLSGNISFSSGYNRSDYSVFDETRLDLVWYSVLGDQ